MQERKISGQSKETEKTVENNWWQKYLTPLPDESPAGYIVRAGKDFTDELASDLLIDEKKIEKKALDFDVFKQEIIKNAILLFDRPRECMSPRELSRQMSLFEGNIRTLTNRINSSKDKVDYFTKTDRTRQFYVAPEGYNEILINELFGIPKIYEFEELKSLYERSINGKTILLLGGGNSMMDLLINKKLTPKMVINIDPYLTEEPIEKNTRQLYQSIPLPAQSDVLVSELERRNIPKVDEIWATYSVPCYLETTDDIHTLFKNIDALLVKNGVARIYPLILANFFTESKETFTTDPYDKREEAFINSVRELVRTGKYNLDIIHGCMHLQKMMD